MDPSLIDVLTPPKVELPRRRKGASRRFWRRRGGGVAQGCSEISQCRSRYAARRGLVVDDLQYAAAGSAWGRTGGDLGGDALACSKEGGAVLGRGAARHSVSAASRRHPRAPRRRLVASGSADVAVVYERLGQASEESTAELNGQPATRSRLHLPRGRSPVTSLRGERNSVEPVAEVIVVGGDSLRLRLTT